MKKTTISNSQILIYLFMSCSFFLSCSYDFEDDYFNKIEQPNTANNTINLNNFKRLDTINLTSKVSYDFIKKETQKIIEVNIFLDGKEINSTWQNDTGNFNLLPERYLDGIHKIEIEYSFNSGSGSIADQTGSEILKKTDVFEFIVARNPPLPPKANATILDGTIFVEWEKPTDLNFNNVYLNIEFKRFTERIQLTNEQLLSGIYNDKKTLLFEGDRNARFFDDFSNVNYFLEFENEYLTRPGNSSSLTYHPSWFNVELELIDFENTNIKWTEHPLHNNFESFEIVFRENTIIGSSKGGTETVNLPFSFDFNNNYVLFTQPISSSIIRSIPTLTFRNIDFTDESIGQFDFDQTFSKGILYNSFSNEYCALVIENRTNNGYEIYLYTYNESDLSLKNKFYIFESHNKNPGPLQLNINPENGNYIIDQGSTTYYVDHLSLSIISKYPEVEEPFSNIITRNNIVKYWDFRTKKIQLINKNNGMLIFEDTSSSAGILSNDGNYFFHINKNGGFVHKIINNTVQLISDGISTNFKPNFDELIFAENYFFYASSKSIKILNLDSNETEIINFGIDQQTIHYDVISKNLIMRQSELVSIYNLETKEIITFNAQDNKFSNKKFPEDKKYYIIIQNGRLIYSQGYFLDEF